MWLPAAGALNAAAELLAASAVWILFSVIYGCPND
jgi:hypothetical protein